MRPGSSSEACRVSSSSSRTMLAIRSSLAGCVIASLFGARLTRLRPARAPAAVGGRGGCPSRPSLTTRERKSPRAALVRPAASSPNSSASARQARSSSPQVDALVDRVVLALLVRGAVEQDLGVGQRSARASAPAGPSRRSRSARPGGRTRPPSLGVIAANPGPSVRTRSPRPDAAGRRPRPRTPQGAWSARCPVSSLHRPLGILLGREPEAHLGRGDGDELVRGLDAPAARRCPSTETAGFVHRRSAIGPEPDQPDARPQRRLLPELLLGRSARRPRPCASEPLDRDVARRRRAAWRGSARAPRARPGSRPAVDAAVHREVERRGP